MACSPSNKRRVWCVFGALVPRPSEVCQIDWRSETAEPRQSTSDHRKPHSSPRRMPVSAANVRTVAISGARDAGRAASLINADT
jgi:hypothetical protein